jgi:hypothetical protein
MKKQPSASVNMQSERLSSIKSDSQKSMREKNKDFEDLEQTGKWGSVNRKEVIGVICGIILIIAAAIAITVSLIVKNSNSVSSLDAPTLAPTGPPGKFDSSTDEYKYLIDQLKLNDATSDMKLPPDFSGLRAESMYEEDSDIEAAAWIVFRDPTNHMSDTIDRFVLSSLYYATDGDNWLDYEKWLSPVHHVCEWKGIVCVEKDGKRTITVIDLTHNGLVGSIPQTLSLLKDLTVLRLGENDLTGIIPGSAFGSLDSLSTLDLQSNKLQGQVPESMRGPQLDTLYLQGNNVTGVWPFCGEPLNDFGVDCTLVECDCCEATINCLA